LIHFYKRTKWLEKDDCLYKKKMVGRRVVGAIRLLKRTGTDALSGIRGLNQTRPLLVSCITYGSLTGLAETSQQTIEKKILPTSKGEDRKELDLSSITRFTVMGGGVISPILHFWYKWLDKKYPGALWKTVTKKVTLDICILAVPLYTIFYVFLNVMEGQGLEHTMAELDAKLVPTIILSVLFWTPAQLINFRFLSPEKRVLFISVCTFIEVNILCVLKKLDMEVFK